MQYGHYYDTPDSLGPFTGFSFGLIVSINLTVPASTQSIHLCFLSSMARRKQVGEGKLWKSNL